MSEQVNEDYRTNTTALIVAEDETSLDVEENRSESKVISCLVCKETDEVRIILRQCGHVFCLLCILEYIKNRIILDGHPRFKCPLSTCNQVVHENDINALLDEKEPALEKYMAIGHRRYLQYKQNKHSVMAGLPSTNIKRCPLCRSVYMHEPGCNYVICANIACNTAFCWQCEKPIGRPCSHFTTTSNCRLGYLDFERLLRSVQLILDVNFMVLWLLFPFVYVTAFLYIPILMVILIPAGLAYDAYRKEKDSHDFLVPIDVVTIIFRVILGIVIGVVVSIPIAVGSIISAFVVVMLYMAFVFIRTVPCGLSGDEVGTVLCLMRWAGRVLNVGSFANLLEEARKERKDALIKLEENKDDFKNELKGELDVMTGAKYNASATQESTTRNTNKDDKETTTRISTTVTNEREVTSKN